MELSPVRISAFNRQGRDCLSCPLIMRPAFSTILICLVSAGRLILLRNGRAFAGARTGRTHADIVCRHAVKCACVRRLLRRLRRGQGSGLLRAIWKMQSYSTTIVTRLCGRFRIRARRKLQASSGFEELAGREGFEPSVALEDYAGLANLWFKPLTHLPHQTSDGICGPAVLCYASPKAK
jgi:hypothetical protein